MIKKLSLITVALSLLASLTSVSRADLFTNSGFETGNFSGWNVNGTAQVLGTPGSIYTHSGTYGASLGSGIVAQSIATTAGHAYDVSFWMKEIPLGGTGLLSVTWGNSSNTTDYGSVVLGGLTGFDPITEVGWTKYDFLVLALSTVGTLKFEFQTQAVTYPNNVVIDDANIVDSGLLYALPILNGVPLGSPSPTLTAGAPYLLASSVTHDASPVPEPSTYGLLAAVALGGAVAWRRRRR